MTKTPQPRRFKVRGQDLVGTEMTRTGDRITLMCAPPGWPFVRERVFSRSELVRIDGGNVDDEPKPGKASKRARKAVAA